MRDIFHGFRRSIYIAAESNECEEILDPEYTPTNAEKDLFEVKQVIMFSVFDKDLLTDMGRNYCQKICPYN